MNSLLPRFLVVLGLLASSDAALGSNYKIDLPKSARPWERAAADDLKTYLDLRLGANALSVDGQSSVVFHVGDTPAAKDKGVLSAQLKEDEWLVRSFGGDVIVNGGGTRGVRYAVSHFLEDCCDVRWWGEMEEDVPRASALKLPKLALSGRPRFLYRDIWRSPERAFATSALAVRRRLNRNGDVPFTAACGGSFDYGPPAHAHTFNCYVPWEKHGKDHPEWFSLFNGKRCGGDDFTTGGQLCLTHPGLRDMFVSQLLAHIARGDAAADAAGVPPPRLYDVSMNDNKQCCQCENCTRAAEKYGVSGVYLRFVNDLAAEVAKTHPDVMLTTLAYYFTEDPPKGGVRAADNVVVKLCNTRANMTVSLLHEDNRVFRELVDAWSKCAKNLFVWDYDVTYTDDSQGYPFPSELSYADKFRYFAEHNVTGLFWEQEYAYRSDLPEIKYYLKCRLAEDPYLDYEKLLERTFNEYYGPKAGPHVLAARRRLVEASRRNGGFLRWFPQLNQFNHLRDEDLSFMQREYDAAAATVAGDYGAVKRRIWRARLGLDRLVDRRARMMRREQGKWVLDPAGYGLYGKESTTLVDDPAAPSEKAVRIALDGDKYKLPLVVAYYDAAADKTVLRHLQKDPPSESGYGWIRAGKIRAADNGYVYLTDQWTVQAHLPSADLVGREFELWVLVRFEKDAVFVGRIELRDAGAKSSADVKYVAHQGEEGLAPNHSLPAYRAAVADKCDFMKLDLRETKDGEIVIQHDADLAYTTGKKVVIREHTADELKAAAVLKTRGGFAGERIVTLDEALAVSKALPGVWLDFKDFSPALAKKALDKVAKAGISRDRVMVATWNYAALEWLHVHEPDLKLVAHTGVWRKGDKLTTSASPDWDTPYDSPDEVVRQIIAFRDRLGLYGVNMPCDRAQAHTTTEDMVRQLKAAGLWVSIWFVDEPENGDYYRRAGADAFVTINARSTGRDIPGALPLRGICALAETKDGLLEAKRLGVQMVAFDARLAKDGRVVLGKDKWSKTAPGLEDALALLPRDGMWIRVQCDGGDVRLASAIVRCAKKSGRLDQVIVDGVLPYVREAAAAEGKSVRCDFDLRGKAYDPATPKTDERFVTQAAMADCFFVRVEEPWDAAASGYAHACGMKVVGGGYGDAASVGFLLDEGFDFICTRDPAPALREFNRILRSKKAAAFRTRVRAPAAGADATRIVQEAIDTAFGKGGGVVTVEKGRYDISSVRLRSNVTLYLKSGALLKATRNPEAYDILKDDRLEPVPEGAFDPGKAWADYKDSEDANAHLNRYASRWNNAIIRLYGATDAAVVGEIGSVIDGSDPFDPRGEDRFRGPHGISAFNSTNLLFRGYVLRNAGNWAHRLQDCASLRFDDITVQAGHDGVHIRTCDRVRIRNCRFHTGDDCVAGFDNADVVVRNCEFNTACSAFRFGGTRVLVEDCRAYGPAEFGCRYLLSADEKRKGVSTRGTGRRNMLSFFTYFSDFSRQVREQPGDILIRNCRVEESDRFLHFNFSGNEPWQQNRPLASIRFEKVVAERLGMSLCAYAADDVPLDLVAKDCTFSFRKPVAEFVRAANLRTLDIENTKIEGVDGSLVRSWKGRPAVRFEKSTGPAPSCVPAADKFYTDPI